MPVVNAMTCDLEDYYQVEGFHGLVSRDDWEAIPSRLEDSTARVLDLFAEAGVSATFFVLGWNAEREPGIVRRVAEAGHEIASHGYAHRLVYDQTPDAFRQDVRRSKALLEDLAGQEVAGYRAPTFSITERSLWAIDILAEEGYRYDSSIFPIRHDRYGIPSAPRFLHHVAGPEGGRLVEFPPTTVRVLGGNLPVAGGGYLRLFPAHLIRAGLRQANRKGEPAIVYFHPWELDADQPRMPVRGLSRFRHYVNLGRTAAKLRLLLRSLAFAPVRTVVDAWESASTRGETAHV